MSQMKGYVFDEHDYKRLYSIRRALYGDGTHMTPDQRRDLANALDYVLSNAMPIKEGDTW